MFETNPANAFKNPVLTEARIIEKYCRLRATYFLIFLGG